METQGTSRSSDSLGDTPVRDRVIEPTPVVAPVRSHIHTEDDREPVKNRVQWGPILAGLVTALTVFLLLTVLGIGLGASVLDPANAGDEVGTWAAIWGAFTALASFLLGGWVAAKTSAVGGSFGGLMNGLMVGAAGIILIIYLTTTGLGNLFGTISSNIGDIASLAGEVAQQEGVTPEEAQGEAQDAATQVQEQVEQIDPNAAFEAVRNGAIGTFLGLLLPVVAAGFGGYLGHNTRYEVTVGSG